MRSALLVAIFFLAGDTFVSAQEEPPRMWVDTRKRQVEAAFVRVDGENAILKLSNGEEVAAPISGLSEADRHWISERLKSADAGPQPGRPPADKEWPRMITLPSTPVVKVIREDSEKKEYIYETEHYEFVCDSPLGANLVREFSRIFEATWLLNCRLPLDFQPEPEDGRKKFSARIYTSESDYTDAGGPPGSAGVYSRDDRELKLPLSSLGVKMFGSRVTIDYASENYSTLVHEITHQMMSHWIAKLPLWYVEGAAEYVEMTKYENGRFSFLQQEKRLRERLASTGESTFQMVPLEKLMNIDSAAWLAAVGTGEGANANYVSSAALTYYFYQLDGDGNGTHFKEYLRAAEKLGPGESDAAIIQQYLLRDRDYTALEKDVQKGLRRAGVNVVFPN